MQWNLAQLASAFLAADLLEKEDAQAAIDEYGVQLVKLHEEGWAAKLGLPSYTEGVATRYMKLMAASEADFTNTFRALTALSHEEAFADMPESIVAACGKDLTAEDRQVPCCFLPLSPRLPSRSGSVYLATPLFECT